MHISGTHSYRYSLPGQTAGRQQESSQTSRQKGDLTPEEQKRVEELKKTDAEVRRHEQAHKAAAGKFAKGGPTFKYETGPDGKRYAVEGEVKIDTTEVSGDPEATLKKAQTVRRAALAPKEPSSQDLKVAAQARQIEAKARQELAQQKKQETQGYDSQGQRTNPASEAYLIDVLA